MNSVVQTRRSITIGNGPSFAKTEMWQDLRSKLIVPTEIVPLATAQRCTDTAQSLSAAEY